MLVMVGAIFIVHWPHGFDVSKGGIEYALTQLLIAIALFLTGAGRYSISAALPPGLRKL
jgi:putative oxidoreductase